VSPDRAWPFLSDPSHPLLSALWAVAIHGLIGVAVVAPIVWRSRHRGVYALLAFVGGFILDIDHFIAASSLSLHTIETLSGRPDTHSLVFAAALAALVALAGGRLLAGWAVFAVNAAHLLFDAAGGNEHILYPLARPDALPWLACPLGVLALAGASAALAGLLMRPASSGAGQGGGAIAA
jgi:LexA-binding, inner membrane-associated putative hydrolase